MSEEDIENFIRCIRESNSRMQRLEANLTECLLYAMRHVKEFDGHRWFGPLIGGTFFMTLDDWRWYPALPMEALGSISAEFGEELTRGLTYP